MHNFYITIQDKMNRFSQNQFIGQKDSDAVLRCYQIFLAHYLDHITVTKQDSHKLQILPLCCHLGSYFKHPKSSPVRPFACNWYYCVQFTAKPKAACALRFSWAATMRYEMLF